MAISSHVGAESFHRTLATFTSSELAPSCSLAGLYGLYCGMDLSMCLTVTLGWGSVNMCVWLVLELGAEPQLHHRYGAQHGHMARARCHAAVQQNERVVAEHRGYRRCTCTDRALGRRSFLVWTYHTAAELAKAELASEFIWSTITLPPPPPPHFQLFNSYLISGETLKPPHPQHRLVLVGSDHRRPLRLAASARAIQVRCWWRS